MTDAAKLLAVIPDAVLPAFVVKSAPARRRSFVAGRLCAERALAQLGHHPASVPRGRAGEPIWPLGTGGSITHNELIACAAVTSRTSATALGIDSEVIVDAAGCPAIEQLCCTEHERVQWAAVANRFLTVTLIFSAKEAYYKAISPTVLRYVDFGEVEVTKIDWRRGLLTLTPIPDRSLAAQVPPAECHFRVDSEMVHTSVVILA